MCASAGRGGVQEYQTCSHEKIRWIHPSLCTVACLTFVSMQGSAWYNCHGWLECKIPVSFPLQCRDMRANAVVVSEETHLQGLWKWISCILYTQRHGPVITLTVLTVPLQSLYSPPQSLYSNCLQPVEPQVFGCWCFTGSIGLNDAWPVVRSLGVDVSLVVSTLIKLDRWSGLWVLMFHWWCRPGVRSLHVDISLVVLTLIKLDHWWGL